MELNTQSRQRSEEAVASLASMIVTPLSVGLGPPHYYGIASYTLPQQGHGANLIKSRVGRLIHVASYNTQHDLRIYA